MSTILGSLLNLLPPLSSFNPFSNPGTAPTPSAIASNPLGNLLTTGNAAPLINASGLGGTLFGNFIAPSTAPSGSIFNAIGGSGGAASGGKGLTAYILPIFENAALVIIGFIIIAASLRGVAVTTQVVNITKGITK